MLSYKFFLIPFAVVSAVGAGGGYFGINKLLGKEQKSQISPTSAGSNDSAEIEKILFEHVSQAGSNKICKKQAQEDNSQESIEIIEDCSTWSWAKNIENSVEGEWLKVKKDKAVEVLSGLNLIYIDSRSNELEKEQWTVKKDNNKTYTCSKKSFMDEQNRIQISCLIVQTQSFNFFKEGLKSFLFIN